MFGFQMNFGEQLEIYDCMLDVVVGEDVQRNRMQAPRIMIEQQFMQLAQQAAQTNAPIRIRMTRKVPVYDEYNDRWIERENSIIFSNSAYADCEE